MKKINEIANTDYKPFNYYGNKEAKKLLSQWVQFVKQLKNL